MVNRFEKGKDFNKFAEIATFSFSSEVPFSSSSTGEKENSHSQNTLFSCAEAKLDSNLVGFEDKLGIFEDLNMLEGQNGREDEADLSETESEYVEDDVSTIREDEQYEIGDLFEETYELNENGMQLLITRGSKSSNSIEHSKNSNFLPESNQRGMKQIQKEKEQNATIENAQAIDLRSKLVCIHDSARPLISSGDISKVLRDGWLNGAAVLGVPVKATIKEVNSNSFVVRTLDRKTLWEMQTPQVIKPELLRKGFELVNREGLEVTDDVSIVEHLKHPVCITQGSYTNIKVTTPDDLLLAERILGLSSEN